MDSITLAPQTVPVWPLSYKGRGFILANIDDDTCQGIIQGGYHTPPCTSLGDALESVRDYIDAQEGK
ncbi:MAG: hypothetical protein H0U76_28150 [Ktedonobacteraceae bacterium]|nr:hypothetical protein [Ktedonobacteraceae bacterium]